MAVRPSELPRWADVSGDIVDPANGKKDVGWVDDEEPANEYFNWYQNLVYQWMQYINYRSTKTLLIPIPFFSGDIGGDYAAPVYNILGGTGASTGNIFWKCGTNGTAQAVVVLPLTIGDRIQSLDVRCVDNHASGQHISTSLYKAAYTVGSTPGTLTQLGSTINSSATPTANVQSLLVDLTGSPETVVVDTLYYMFITLAATANDVPFYGAFLTYDQP